jgi:hypothetical protein
MSNEPLVYDPNTVTGNGARDNLLTLAIMKLEQAGDDPSVLASVQLELPKDFDLDAGELAAMLAHMNIKPVEAPTREALAVEAVADETVPEPVESQTMTADEARDAVVMWEKRLAQARGARLGAEQKARDLRGRLGAAVQEFVQGFSQLSPEENVRQMIASEQARKAAGIPINGGRTRTGGPSVVDMAAGSADGSSANRSFAPKFRRGAFTQKGGMNFDPRRGPVAKPPSER